MLCIPQNDLDCYYNSQWRKRRLNKKDKHIDIFKEHQSHINDCLDNIIETSECDKFNKFRNSYQNKSLETLKIILENITDRSLSDKVIYMTKLNIPSLFNLSVTNNFTKPVIYTLKISDPELSLGYNEIYLDYDYKNKDRFNDLHNISESIYDFVKYDINFPINNSKKIFCSDILMMEFIMAPNLLSIKESNDPILSSNILDCDAFIKKYDVNNFWKSFMSSFNNQYPIQYANHKYLVFLKSCLKMINMDENFSRMIQNYFIYNSISYYGNYTKCAPILSKLSFIKYDEKKIYRSVFTTRFGLYLENIYETQYADLESNKIVESIIIHLIDYCKDVWGNTSSKDSYQNNTKLFSDTTKEKALEKINNIKYIIGTANNSLDMSTIPTLTDEFFSNLMILDRFLLNQSLSFVGKKVDRNIISVENDIYSFSLNAYCSQDTNTIYIPTSIINSKLFFDKAASLLYNYGGIGCVIGHEIMHLFDSKGSLYDSEGLLNNWWDQTDYKAFKKETNKVYKHYNNLDINGIKINANNTLGEDIADICGIKISLRAYYKITKNTDLELFFRRWASLWRFDYDELHVKKIVTKNVHSPHIIRINSPFSHIDEYYEVFNVQPHHLNYLDRKHRCRLMD
jgi:predicted metalloendopeptidase